jgi:hypothetical protein
MPKKNVSQPPKYDYQDRDEFYWESLEKMFKRHGLSYENVLRNWPAYVMRRDLPRFLAHYELFNQVIDLPGDIIDLGVYKGASFFTWAKLLETFCATDRYRKVFGFDHFEGLRGDQFAEEDGAKNEADQKIAGGYKALAEEVRTLVQLHNADNLLPGTERCRLVEGDILETLPKFLEENPGLKISLLHLDVDLYKPTRFALELLYPHVVKGGIICFDEYGRIPWQGETKAVDEFFAAFSEPPVIMKFSFIHTPGGYLVK